MKDFVNFIREQGVVGLAVGFILGGAVSGLVSSLVEDIINPLVGVLFQSAGSLSEFKIVLVEASNGGPETAIMIGSFISVFIDFLIVAAVVYFGFKALKLEKLDKKKD